MNPNPIYLKSLNTSSLVDLVRGIPVNLSQKRTMPNFDDLKRSNKRRKILEITLFLVVIGFTVIALTLRNI